MTIGYYFELTVRREWQHFKPRRGSWALIVRTPLAGIAICRRFPDVDESDIVVRIGTGFLLMWWPRLNVKQGELLYKYEFSRVRVDGYLHDIANCECDHNKAGKCRGWKVYSPVCDCSCHTRLRP